MPEQADARQTRRLPAQLLVGLLVGVLAFAMTTQIGRGEETDYSTLRGVELVELLKSIDAANERLGSQIDELSTTRDGLLSSRSRSEDAAEAARKRADQLAVLAGSVGAVGPGVRIEVDDPEGVVDAALLLDAVQELRDAGAEAIVVNDTARVVAQTWFLDDEDGVRVGGRQVSSPFVIEAIGDQDTLAEAARFRGGIADRFGARGAEAEVEGVDRITITALADVKSPEYARASADESP